MRKTSLLVLMALIVAIAAPVLAQDSTKFNEPVYIGQGGNIRWSPDGTKISYFSEGWLVVADSGDIAQTTRVGQYRFSKYCWASDSSFLGMERWYNEAEQPWYRVTRMVEVGIDGTEKEVARDSAYADRSEKGRIGWPTRLRDGTAGYYGEMSQPGEVRSFVPLRVSKALRKGSPWQMGRTTIMEFRNDRLMEWTMGDIWLVDFEGQLVKQITFDQLFYFPQLSPTGDLILASAAGGGLAILDTLGSIVWCPIEHAIKLPNGHIAGPAYKTWAPDGESIAYVLAEEDGHFIFGGDICIATLADRSIKRVTNSPDVEKFNPSWFPHGGKIIFADETGSLYTLEVD